MSETKRLIIGVDVGGSKINALLADADGNIEAQSLKDTLADEGPDAVIGRIIEAISQLTSGVEVAGIGIGAAGAYDAERGAIAFSPNLPGWNNIPLRDIISREFGLPTYLQNDCTLAALGEHRFGAGVGVDNLVYVGLGTGIGGGIIADGQIYTGTSGAAGEIGHMIIDINGSLCKCGSYGCWENYASGRAIAQEAARQMEAGIPTAIRRYAGGDATKVTAQKVLQAAQDGDYIAHEIISRTAYYVGIGLVNLVNIFNPELILIGGGLANMGSLLLDQATKVVQERVFEISAQAVRIELAQLGNDAAALGAVALVLQEIRSKTS
jgi:glucokinase